MTFFEGFLTKHVIQQTFSVDYIIFADFFTKDLFDSHAFENYVGRLAHGCEV
jgi:hypothetical protein